MNGRYSVHADFLRVLTPTVLQKDGSSLRCWDIDLSEDARGPFPAERLNAGRPGGAVQMGAEVTGPRSVRAWLRTERDPREVVNEWVLSVGPLFRAVDEHIGRVASVEGCARDRIAAFGPT